MSQVTINKDQSNLNNSGKPYSIQQPINNQSSPQIQSPSALQQTLKHMQTYLQTQIQSGTLTINLQPTPLSSSTLSQKPLSQSLTPFYISSNPSVIRQKYTQLLQIKQEYSHPRNQQTIKEMEEVVRSWMKRQKVAKRKREQVKERMEKQKVLEMERQEQERRRSLEQKLEQYRKRLGEKIENRRMKKEQEEKLIKADSISKQMLKYKQPLYKQKEKQFHQQQSIERQAKTIQLSWKKQSLAPYYAKNLKQHRLKVAQQIKHSSQQRLQTTGSPKRIKTQSLLNFNNTRTQQFITTKNYYATIKQQEQKKRFRIKQYVERLKSMSPDQATLERIKKVKEQIVSSQKMFEDKIMKRIGGTETVVRKRNLSVRNLFKEVEKDKVSKEQRLEMGNRYMKERLKVNKVKTENRNNDTIEENPQDSSSLDHQIGAKQIIQAKQQKQKKYSKSKTQTIQHPTQTTPPPQNPITIKQHKSKSLKTLPSHNTKPLFPEPRPQYKNYLPEVKHKLANSKSTLQKVRKGLKYPQEIFREFGKQSLELQKKLMKKINEFKRIQSSEKYEKNLLREREIDELYHKNLRMKLACLAIE